MLDTLDACCCPRDCVCDVCGGPVASIVGAWPRIGGECRSSNVYTLSLPIYTCSIAKHIAPAGPPVHLKTLIQTMITLWPTVLQ